MSIRGLAIVLQCCILSVIMFVICCGIYHVERYGFFVGESDSRDMVRY